MITVRARVRALRPRAAKRIPAFILRVAEQADVGVDGTRIASIVAVGIAAGGVLAGLAGAAFGAVSAPAAAYLWVRKRAAARLDRIADAFPDGCRGLADALRSGSSLAQAISLVAAEAPAPLSAELRRAGAEIDAGTAAVRAVASFAQRCPVPGAELLAVGCAVVMQTGADLAPILDGVVASARDRARLARELRAATAQGRMTAMVVAALPFAFLAIVGAGSHGELDLLLHEPIGWALLGVGGTLEGAGALWIRRMVRQA